MRTTIPTLVVILLLLLSILGFASIYTVDETQIAVVTQFGEMKNTVTNAGLHFKVPFVQEIDFLEKRLMPWDSDPESMQTSDKKRIFIKVWARWKIVDATVFYPAVRTEQGGQKILDDLVDSAVRDVIARHKLIQVVRSTNKPLLYEDEEIQRNDVEQFESGRGEIEKEILKTASTDLHEEYGMEIKDVRVMRVNYIDSVKQAVYERMRAERLRIASLYESEAEEERNRILGRTRKELDQIEGEMKAKSDIIRGEAEAKVIQITANAYNQSPSTLEFYKFLRKLEVLKTALGSDSHVVLSTDSELFKLLTSPDESSE